ncbi:MAG: amino acid permease [Candidatus Micrarchaeota archaeon]|nr:amino acid permease [Candidatus Micrarchaeota archaeon]
MAGKAFGLRRTVGLFQLVAYGVGNIIGAGIYVLVGAASGLAGGEIWLAFLVGAFVALFTGLSYAELGSMYPKAASEYVYVGRAYGNRLFSFLAEWIMLITEIVAAATVSIGFALYFQSVFAVPIIPLAAVLLAVLTFLSIVGIKQSLGVNTILSIVAILGLIVVIGAGIPKLGSTDYSYSPGGISGVFAAAILVFFAYIGFDNIANLSEETKRPEKTIPRGLLIAVAITTLLYVLVSVSAVSLVPWQKLSASDAPLALAASATLGEPAFIVLTIAALFTTLNTVLVLLIVGSRIIYGMAREGALPKLLGTVSKRTGTPYVASIVTLLVALAFLSLGGIGVVARITSFGSLIVFAMVNLSLLHLRRVAPHLKRPFKAPLSIGWLSVTGLIGFVSCLALLTQFDATSVALGLILPVSGIIFYLAMNRGRPMHVEKGLHQRHEGTGPAHGRPH